MRAMVKHRIGRGHDRMALSAVPILLLALAAVALAVDLPLAKWISANRPPSFLCELFDAAETFGHGVGAVCIIAAIWTLDVPRRWAAIGIFMAAIGSGLAADGVKLLISRHRPRDFTFAGGSVLDTFGGLLPPDVLTAGRQSFPSAHAATAVGLAVGLATSYPRGRLFFATLAVLACTSRVAVGAHFLSDVLVGAAIGWLAGHGCMGLSAKASRRSQPAGLPGRCQVAADVHKSAA